MTEAMSAAPPGAKLIAAICRRFGPLSRLMGIWGYVGVVQPSIAVPTGTPFNMTVALSSTSMCTMALAGPTELIVVENTTSRPNGAEICAFGTFQIQRANGSAKLLAVP